ncbi:hypothetical protein KC19_2G214100 [Ceratodon purpureus]|uniref:Uncharacterized protein n=1 Tax=Ceratodon purpureus TaxID=3225 RepID=A0A8T0IZA6_CERPU|nr:hypothetical protein KC19_2G214100 [Ceratodon purpureus]
MNLDEGWSCAQVDQCEETKLFRPCFVFLGRLEWYRLCVLYRSGFFGDLCSAWEINTSTLVWVFNISRSTSALRSQMIACSYLIPQNITIITRCSFRTLQFRRETSNHAAHDQEISSTNYSRYLTITTHNVASYQNFTAHLTITSYLHFRM